MEMQHIRNDASVRELSEAALVSPWTVQELPEEPVRSLFKSFSEDFDSLDREGQSRLLEAFIVSASICDADIAPLLEKTTVEQQKTLAEFLVFGTTRRDMTGVLDKCWNSIPSSEREEFKEHLSKAGKEGALMVAPYADLSIRQIPLKKFINDELKLEQPTASPLSLYFNDLESAKQVFTATLRLGSSDCVDPLIEYYRGKSKALIVHLLPDLLAGGVISPADAQGILTEDTGFLRNVGEAEFFSTPQEKLELERLQKLAEKADPENADYPELWPRELLVQYNRIDEKVLARRADTLLGRFPEIEHLFPDDGEKLEFLKKATQSGVSALAYLDILRLSSGELQELLNFVDEEFCVPLFDPQLRDVEQLVTIGKEKFVVDSYLNGIEQRFDDLVSRVLGHVEKAEKLLSPSSFNKIAKAITTHCPNLWCERLDYVAEAKVISPDILILVLSRNEYLFGRSYSSLTQDEEFYDQDKLRSIALQVLETAPYLVFHSDFTDRLLKPHEKRIFIERHLNDTSAPTFEEFMKEGVDRFHDDPSLTVLKDSFTRALRDSPAVLAALAQDEFGWRYAETFISSQERWSILCDNLGRIDLQKILSEYDVVTSLLENPSELQEVLEYMENAGEADAYRSFSKNALGRNAERLSRSERYVLYQLKQKVLETARKNPSLVFFDDSTSRLGEEARSLIEEHAEAFFAGTPQRLFRFKDLLGPELYEKLFKKHIRDIALGHSDEGSPHYQYYPVPEDLEEMLLELDPLRRVVEAQEGDAYQLLLKECSSLSSFELVRPQMEALALGQTLAFKDGDVSWDYIKREYLALARRAAALDASPFFNHYKGEIEALPLDKREEVSKLIELAFMKDLDIVRASSLDEELEEVRARLSLFWSNTFGVEEFRITSDLDEETMQALSTYNDLKCAGNGALKKPMKDLLYHLGLGAFDTWRAWDQQVEPTTQEEKQMALHRMQERALLPQKLSLEQYEAWVEDLSSTGEERLEYSPSEFARAMKQVIRQGLDEKRLPAQQLGISYEDARRELQSVLKPLQELEKLREEIKLASKVKDSGFEELYRECGREIKNYAQENRYNISRARAGLALVALKEGKVHFNSSGELLVDRSKMSVESLANLLVEVYGGEKSVFEKGIKQLSHTILHFRELWLRGNEGLTFFVTDKPTLKAHLLLGERPVVSCQNWGSRQEYNKGLLSYCVDPGVRIVQVYKGEEIVARSVLRLLEEQDGSPALFLEKTYSKYPHTSITEVIAREARRKAENLGVSLYSADAGPEVTLQKTITLYARGSRSRYVYTDVGEGLKTNGEFVVKFAFEG